MKKILLLIFVCTSFTAISQPGITWNMGMNLAANTYGNMHPRMALDGAGNPMVVWGRMSDKSVMFSKWNGAAFTTPVKLNPAWLSVAAASWMGPDIASKGDTVYVVVKRAPENSDTNRVFIFTSFNGGAAFNAPVELAVIADSQSRFPTVATDAAGNPIVAYMKFNAAFMESRWVVTKSADYGNSFMTDVNASGYSGANAEACDCCPGAIVTSGSKSVMLYRDNLSNIRDIWAGISTNNNTSFPTGFKADNNNWMVMMCPASGPDGVIIGDTVYTTYMSAGGGSSRCYLSKSSLTAGAVNTVSNLTGALPGLTVQNYPRIANSGNAMAIVWTQTVNGAGQLPVLFTNDITNGAAFDYDTVDLADVTNTDVAMSSGNIYVVWQDDNSGTIKYRSGTYPLVNVGVKDIAENNFAVFPNPVSSTITLQANFDLNNTELNIYNLLGETVLSQSKISHATVDVKKLISGTYILQLKSDGKVYTQKFVKE